MSLMMHTSSGNYCTLDEIKEVPLPNETRTYKPVSHYDLAVNLGDVSKGLLRGYELDKTMYGLARDGNQMFGIHTYRNGISSEMGLSVGFRNSYDKSMSVGIAIGASVFVCDNMAFTGNIAIMRKHTQNVWNDLEELIITTIYRSQNNFHKIVEDAQEMKSQYLSNDNAFRMIGLLYGNGIVTPRQIPTVKKEWLSPSYEEFADRNIWSFYNCVTEALKTSPPNKIMEKHISLHEILGGN